MYPPTLHKYNERQSSFPSNIFIDVAKEILVFHNKKRLIIFPWLVLRKDISYILNQNGQFIRHYSKSFVLVNQINIRYVFKNVIGSIHIIVYKLYVTSSCQTIHLWQLMSFLACNICASDQKFLIMISSCCF